MANELIVKYGVILSSGESLTGSSLVTKDYVDSLVFASGSVGATGSQGATGPVGPQGVTGSTGTSGSQGATGPQGSVGSTGVQGATGPQGLAGVQGFTGSQGSIGPQGSIGTTGSQGSTGPQGMVGSAGSTGSQGFQGSVGPQGTTGVQGDQGSVGPQGTTGSQGFQGPTGANLLNNWKYSTISPQYQSFLPNPTTKGNSIFNTVPNYIYAYPIEIKSDVNISEITFFTTAPTFSESIIVGIAEDDGNPRNIITYSSFSNLVTGLKTVSLSPPLFLTASYYWVFFWNQSSSGFFPGAYSGFSNLNKSGHSNTSSPDIFPNIQYPILGTSVPSSFTTSLWSHSNISLNTPAITFKIN